MRRCFILLAALGILFQSCVTYTDKDKPENAKVESVELLHGKVLIPTFCVIELADFFDRYQEIKEDRAQTLLLGYECFGDRFGPGSLLYEEFTLHPWGKVRITDNPAIYIVEPEFSGYSYDFNKFYVEDLGERKYHVFSSDPETRLYHDYVEPDMKVRIDAYVDCGVEDVIVIESLVLNYEEMGRECMSTAEITTGASAVKVNTGTDNFSDMIPYEGTLNYKLEGTLFKDEFSIRYHKESFTLE